MPRLPLATLHSTDHTATLSVMKLIVTNRKEVERGFVIGFQEDHTTEMVAVVSIRDAWSRHIHIPYRVVNGAGILRLAFEDDTDGDLAIKDRDADEAVQFFFEMLDKSATTMIVHCEAGISRSAAMAAAFSIMLGQESKEFFAEPTYYPNPLVFRTVLDAWTRHPRFKTRTLTTAEEPV